MNFDNETYRVPEGKFPVPAILDTDTYNEIDDQFALIYALLTPECIDLKGVTAAPFFNHRSTSPGEGMEKSYLEIVRIIELMGFKGKVPAFRGSTSYLPDRATPVRSQAAEIIIAEAIRARKRGEKLFVMAIGAITNVGSALLISPDIANDIVVIWLGGHDYNFRTNDEFNLYQDIPAAQVVIDSAAPFVRIPCCHVASALTTTVDELEKDMADCGEPGKYLFSIFKDYMITIGQEHEKKVVWDISAISYLTNFDATAWEVVPREQLEDDSRWTHSETDQKMLLAKKIDRDALFNDLYSRIRKHVMLNR